MMTDSDDYELTIEDSIYSVLGKYKVPETVLMKESLFERESERESNHLLDRVEWLCQQAGFLFKEKQTKKTVYPYYIAYVANVQGAMLFGNFIAHRNEPVNSQKSVSELNTFMRLQFPQLLSATILSIYPLEPVEEEV